MFRIGEFSKIAQVSGRLLRYYDSIGLLTPEHTDPATGYRYYSAHQLPRLNRILALKDLGLSLDQITRLMDDNITPDTLRGMLTMKKAQLEQTLSEELARLRSVEARLLQIDDNDDLGAADVIVKEVPGQKFLSMRKVLTGFPAAREILFEMQKLLPAKVGTQALGNFLAIAHNEDFELDDIDLEMGFLLSAPVKSDIALPDGTVMTIRELPAATMATAIRIGNIEKGHLSYGAIGAWVEANNYEFAGTVREMFIQLPSPTVEEPIAEIQYPVRRKSESTLLP